MFTNSLKHYKNVPRNFNILNSHLLKKFILKRTILLFGSVSNWLYVVKKYLLPLDEGNDGDWKL